LAAKRVNRGEGENQINCDDNKIFLQDTVNYFKFEKGKGMSGEKQEPRRRSCARKNKTKQKKGSKRRRRESEAMTVEKKKGSARKLNQRTVRYKLHASSPAPATTEAVIEKTR